MSLLTKKFVNNVVTVFNGNGHVSMNLISRLGKHGAKVIIAHRGSLYGEQHRRVAGGLGQIYFSQYNLKDENSLRDAMQHSDVVVNTIGKGNETRNFTFDDVHCHGPARMARIARECGVKKFIHLSALNATPNPTPHVLKNGSQFYTSKYKGELAVREEFPDAIIFRPADVVGERDVFINHYTSFHRARLTHKMAIWDYYDGVTKQPVYVKDLVSGITNAIENDWAMGKTFQAVGPHRYDFYELIEYIRACGGQGQKWDEYRITNLRWDFGMRLMISIAEKINKYPFCTWERVERDCTTDYVDPNLPTLTDLGVKLNSLEKIIETLAFYRPRGHRVEIPFESIEVVDLPKRL